MLNMWKNLSKSLRKSCVKLLDFVNNFFSLSTNLCKSYNIHKVLHYFFNIVSTYNFMIFNLFRRSFYTVST